MTYIKYKDGDIYKASDDVVGVEKVLAPGFYKPSFNQSRELKLETLAPKELHAPLMIKPLKDTMNYIEQFCSDDAKKRINDMGYLHKAGIFLWGKAGTMKTTFSWFMADRLVKSKEAIVLDTGVLDAMLETVKVIRSKQDNLIVVLIDEIDLYVEMQASLKRFLDGPDSIDNMVVISTTNHRDVFHSSFFRPSRFAIETEIRGIEDVSIIKKLLEKKGIEYTEDDLQVLKGSSMDEIKDFMRNKVLNITINTKYVKQMGFKRTEEDEDTESLSEKEVYNAPTMKIFNGFFDE